MLRAGTHPAPRAPRFASPLRSLTSAFLPARTAPCLLAACPGLPQCCSAPRDRRAPCHQRVPREWRVPCERRAPRMHLLAPALAAWPLERARAPLRNADGWPGLGHAFLSCGCSTASLVLSCKCPSSARFAPWEAVTASPPPRQQLPRVRCHPRLAEVVPIHLVLSVAGRDFPSSGSGGAWDLPLAQTGRRVAGR